MKVWGEGCRGWSLMVVPCLLWSCLPAGEDVLMLGSFLLSQLAFYTLSSLKGVLLLLTLILILWTKTLIRRWYRSQVLTREFFSSLLYLLTSVSLSLLTVGLVSGPLHAAYDSVVSSLDKASAQTALGWREPFFLILAVAMATSAITHTDLVLRPSQITDCGLPWLLERVLCCSTWWVDRGMRKAFRLLKAACRSVMTLHFLLGRLPAFLCQTYARGLRKVCKNRPAVCDDIDDDDDSLCSSDDMAVAGFNPKPKNRGAVDCTSSSHSLVKSTSELLKRCVVPTFRGQGHLAQGHGGQGQRGQGAMLRRVVAEPLASADAAQCKEGRREEGRKAGDARSVVDSTSTLLHRCVTPAFLFTARRASFGQTSASEDAMHADRAADAKAGGKRGGGANNRQAEQLASVGESDSAVLGLSQDTGVGPSKAGYTAKRPPGRPTKSMMDTSVVGPPKAGYTAKRPPGRPTKSMMDTSVVGTTSNLLKDCVVPNMPRVTRSSTSRGQATPTHATRSKAQRGGAKASTRRRSDLH